MNKIIRSIAIFFSVIIFFVMALAGVLAGREPLLCAYRAVTGALLFYLAVNIAVRIVFTVFITALVKSRSQENSD
jgi:hypothetical protein